MPPLHPLETHLLAAIAGLERGYHEAPPSNLSLEELFEAQVQSRIVDHIGRFMRAEGRGYYTIGSAGHESNAAVALALRPTDPALLHYRSGGFYVARANQANALPAPPSNDFVSMRPVLIDPVSDMIKGMLAHADEAIAGGRHKVFGRAELDVIPQTSTIASHLPRAVGLALAIGGSTDRQVDLRWQPDALVVCSFGDASLNHSTTQGALNWAAYEAHRGTPVPVLFVCEDNGLGISVRSPAAWTGRSISARPLAHVTVDGTDPQAVFDGASALAELARDGQPCLLHLRTVRFMGHAGSDVESAYRSRGEMQDSMRQDPLVGTARALTSQARCRAGELTDWYLDERQRIWELATELMHPTYRELASATEIMEPLGSSRPGAVAHAVELMQEPIRAFADADSGDAAPQLVDVSQSPEPLTLSQAINSALHEILDTMQEALVFGEDVGVKGGVYGVTRGLQTKFGDARVFDTLLDEQSILGLANGSAVAGHLPIPEIQFLAYVHNAADQIRGEAATLQFFSQGQFRNPMVIRIAGYGYQKGFGGHFHNDNSVAALLDLPGVVVASPSHPSDAAAMLRTCAATAATDGVVCIFLEPIARYHTTDLHDEGDRLWTHPHDVGHVSVGTGRTHGDGSDLTIMTWGNGLYLSLRAQRKLRRQGINARVLDLRWLNPLPVTDIMREAEATGRVLVVDETRQQGGVGQSVLTALVENGFDGALYRVSAANSLIPLGGAAELVLVSEQDIIDAAEECMIASAPRVFRHAIS